MRFCFLNTLLLRLVYNDALCLCVYAFISPSSSALSVCSSSVDVMFLERLTSSISTWYIFS
jgi:hypothetical protein